MSKRSKKATSAALWFLGGAVAVVASLVVVKFYNHSISLSNFVMQQLPAGISGAAIWSFVDHVIPLIKEWKNSETTAPQEKPIASTTKMVREVGQVFAEVIDKHSQGVVKIMKAAQLSAETEKHRDKADKSELLTAPAFGLVDKLGRTRARLSLVDDQPSLAFFDGVERLRFALGLSSDGSPIMTLLDENGVVRAGLSADENGVSLNLSDNKGNLRIFIDVTDGDGSSALMLGDGTGELRASLMVDKESDPYLSMFKPGEKGAISLGVSEGNASLVFGNPKATSWMSVGEGAGHMGVSFSNPQDSLKLVLGVTKEGRSDLVFFASNGDVRSSISVDENGNPDLFLVDAEGNNKP